VAYRVIGTEYPDHPRLRGFFSTGSSGAVKRS
jgi:hypothetical protein